MIRETGIRVKGLFMMGLPGETEKSIKATFELIRKYPFDEINISKLIPFPGSSLYENIEKYGTFKEDWDKMDCMNFLFIPEELTKERLQDLFTEGYRSYFTKPKTLWNYISMLYHSPDSWFRFLKNAFSFLKFAGTDERMT